MFREVYWTGRSKYPAKHNAWAEARAMARAEQSDIDRLERAVQEVAREGRLPCARALELARQFNVPPAVVREAADRLRIKISACQLGCF